MTTTYDVAVKIELVGVPQEQRTTPKLTHVQAGYTEVAGQHICRECWWWIEREGEVGRCAIVAGTIKATGTCNVWYAGAYMETTGPSHRPVENATKLSQVEAGYMERDGGFRCATCRRFDAEHEACRVVYGAIRSGGCCNFWSDGHPWVRSPSGQETHAPPPKPLR